MGDENNAMNISELTAYLSGYCDLKCDYSFYYQPTSCSVYINTLETPVTSLNFTYDKNPTGMNQVLYNGIEYDVSMVQIYSPSIHFFDCNLTDGEIVIVHQSNNGLILNVCLPITSYQGANPNYYGEQLVASMINNGISTVASNQLQIDNLNQQISDLENNDLIKSANDLGRTGNKIKDAFKRIRHPRDRNITAPSTIEDQLQSLQTSIDAILTQPQSITTTGVYTLDTIVPKNPFFSYSIPTENASYIVFGTSDAIYYNNDIQYELSTINVQSSWPTTSTPVTCSSTNYYDLFLNQNGPTSLMTNNLSDEIYIDCQPTGSSNDKTNLTTSTSTTQTSQPSNAMFFIYVAFFLIVLFIIYMVFAYISHPDKKNFSIGGIKNPFV
jgi:hypothetical protein